MIKIRYILYNFRRWILAVISCLTEPAPYLIRGNPGFPVKTGIQFLMDSRWSLSRTAIRGGNDKTALLKELRKLYILLFALFSMLYILCFLPYEANAASDWQVTLRVEAGTGFNRLVLGADKTATDGYDNAWEVYALLDGEIQAYFPHYEWNMDHNVFWRDIRADAAGTIKEWLFEIKSSLNNNNFTIKWDLSKIPENYTISLIDGSTGQNIDMRSTTSYSFLYTGSMTSPMTFRVAVYVPPDVAPPDAPVGLWAITSGKGRIVTLQWSANTEADIAGYNVYRSLTSGTGYERLNKSLIKSPSYRGTQLKKDKTYYYVVTAVNTSGMKSGYSNEVAVTAK